MLPREKNRQTLAILSKLRDRGVPAPSPFPGEQEAEGQDQDLDLLGQTTSAISPELAAVSKLPKKKKRPATLPAPASDEEAIPPTNVIGQY